MFEKLKDQPAVGKLIAQYDQLPRRDQQALMVLALAVFLGVLYFAIWRPAMAFSEKAEAQRENAGELLAWMQANESTIKRLGSAGTGSSASTANAPADGRALMALVTRSAREGGLSLQRFEPSGDDAIRVWIEDAPFAEVAAWLESLKSNHGVIIDQAAMDRSREPGLVSARLTLAI
ncbi:General secretion pathway protein M [Marinobacter nitratireducens]|uniref:Type II secretion system protein M n=1 Tax=Marinobacter nitratireducens TaxID=1137280 RepID=A0A072N426_9GAMM|nr:type II secretion system protein M [Marinobacter nitratireducens]KEF32474.1 General secretion pathway protein M [Marinobacter nitratireducens]TNF01212.1 MAG: type II secretion system protein M [Gammaproteobacteria bacterium]